MYFVSRDLSLLTYDKIGRPQYDWCMTSVEQPTAGNKVYSMPRGKLLGGSSGINYLMYVRGSKGGVCTGDPILHHFTDFVWIMMVGSP